MAIIKPKQTIERAQVRISVDVQVLEEIKLYCTYANFHKQDEFFEEAALHILSKDKDFKEWKDKAVQTAN